MKTFHTDVAVLIEKLLILERGGRYEEALAELRPVWKDTCEFPEIEELPERQAAEIILRCGAVIGFLGHIKQIPHSQEKSKNLLTEARNRFLNLYDTGKIAECESHIALAYWRTGELVEAETWIEEALHHDLPVSSQTRLYAYAIRCLIYFQLNKIEENLEFFSTFENDFLNYAGDSLKGDFYNHYGLNLRRKNRRSEALDKYHLAKDYYQKAGHQIYLGAVENNIAYLFKSEGKFGAAHEAIDRSTKIFKQIKDRTREGFSLDTKAAIYCDEGKYGEALTVIDKALGILRKSENAAYLAETCLTKSKVLLHLDDFSAAFLSLTDAVQVARTRISEEAAKNLIKEFEKLLREKNSPSISDTYVEKAAGDQNLRLVLPPSLSHYRDFQGVWIKNSYLENFGLDKGSLAVVTKDSIARGDLIAVMEVSTESVLCGFYDAEFGIVCLEGIGSEPLLFDENEIKILGKIIGVCRSEKSADGQMTVEPIKL
jgi:tetratricopeptide (TPR) repeat protein